MTTRRDLLKLGSFLGLTAAVPALAAQATALDPADHVTVSPTQEARITGRITLYDPHMKALMDGEIAFLSDGASRSEIIVRNDDTGEEHRITFCGPTYFPALNTVIQAMRYLYSVTDMSGVVS